jgi:hypothetical protein
MTDTLALCRPLPHVSLQTGHGGDISSALMFPMHHLETFTTIFISVIPIVGISLATWIAVHAGNGGLM